MQLCFPLPTVPVHAVGVGKMRKRERARERERLHASVWVVYQSVCVWDRVCIRVCLYLRVAFLCLTCMCLVCWESYMCVYWVFCLCELCLSLCICVRCVCPDGAWKAELWIPNTGQPSWCTYVLHSSGKLDLPPTCLSYDEHYIIF